ncbi:MAG: replication initiation protein RepC [Methylobacteriaceae bacterium]|nr:replication initiation protein RepC [Methylobacteriaceae bacterium]
MHREPLTPFGGRLVKLAHVVTLKVSDERSSESVVHKWRVLDAVIAAKERLGVPQRAITVLSALLSFHPEAILSGDRLLVFPSNQQLSHRTQGMAHATLRRHLASLVDAGLIIRRDSPNGKRYARRGRDGEIETAFGFDLGPLVARADEIREMAEAVLSEQRALDQAREKLTICRRDAAKFIATGLEEGVEIPPGSGLPGSWEAVHELFRGIVARIPRRAPRSALESLADELGDLADQVEKLFLASANSEIMSANASHSERQHQNSNPESSTDSEPVLRGGRVAAPVAKDVTSEAPRSRARSEGAFPLRMVLEACPDLSDYSKRGISDWRDFLATVNVVRPLIGISPSAWEDAQEAMGEVYAAIALACILQKGPVINSAGGYLRELARKAKAGEFSVGPMLMALLAQRTGRKTA